MSRLGVEFGRRGALVLSARLSCGGLIVTCSKVGRGVNGTPRLPLVLQPCSPRCSGRAGSLSRRSASVVAVGAAGSGTIADLISPQKFKPHKAEGSAQTTFFSDLPLDRAAHLRGDDEGLHKLWVAANAKAVPVMNRTMALSMESAEDNESGGSGLLPVFLQPASEAAAKLGVEESNAIFLGLDAEGAAVFAFGIEEEAGNAAAESGAEWLNVRQSGSLLDSSSAAVLALAVGVVGWSRSASFCSFCGAPMVPSMGGHMRSCSSGQRSCRPTYPRIDPAAIMLITCEDYVLLGRSSRWKPGRFSCLAGFLEVGETLEMNVAREVKEEAGVDVELSSVNYHSSQPWPFPRSLMVGFTAHAPPRSPTATAYSSLSPEGRDAAITTGLRPDEVEAAVNPLLQVPNIDKDELEEAAWFHKDWIVDNLNPSQSTAAAWYSGGDVEFGLPGTHSLARNLIDGWIEQGSKLAAPADWPGNAVKTVSLDEGVFKYVLARVHGQGHSKLVVWGDTRAGYHNNVFQQIRSAARTAGLEADVLGGGRIEHYSSQRCCSIYGYSVAFGSAAHEVTAALIRRAFPLYPPGDVTISYEGY